MKNLKKIAAAVLVSAMAFSLAGCGSVKAVSMKDFKKVVKAVDSDDLEDNYIEIDEDEIKDWYSEYDHMDIINVAHTYDGDVYFVYYQFEDADAAADYFEDVYDDFKDELEDNELDGKQKSSLSKNSGYIMYKGEFEYSFMLADDMYFSTDDYLVGIYRADDMVVISICESDHKSDVELYNAFIKEIGFPSI